MKKFLFFIIFFALQAHALTFSGSIGDAQLWLDENASNLLEKCNPEQLVKQSGISLERANYFCEKIASKYEGMSIKDIGCPMSSMWISDGKQEGGYKCNVLMSISGEEKKISFDIAIDDNTFKYKGFEIPVDFDTTITDEEKAWIEDAFEKGFSKECEEKLVGKVYKYPELEEDPTLDEEYREAVKLNCKEFPKEECQILEIKQKDSVMRLNPEFRDLFEVKYYAVDVLCPSSQKKNFILKVLQTTNGPKVWGIHEKE